MIGYCTVEIRLKFCVPRNFCGLAALTMAPTMTGSPPKVGDSPEKVLMWPTRFEDKCEQLSFVANTDPRLPPAFSKSDEVRIKSMTKEMAEKRRASLLDKERKAEKEAEAERAAAKTEWKQRQKVRPRSA